MRIETRVKELLNKEYPLETYDNFWKEEFSWERLLSDKAKCALFTVEDIIKELSELTVLSPKIYQALNTLSKLCIDILNPKLKFYLDVKQELIKLIQ